ncbi:MAG: DNA helicase RecQ [Gammaproteobacteria bacterium]|jgi:ATP-dependent DNA helicase RecQ|nr:DNA helicase RecQ [Gammaproteobacteria bacterium]MDP6537665.1 DNA helicase RecQ [Gammaproteobacteria bacterium]MDP6732913.1 DNA helicase RecQ [Gammaproteobacteria bacterium]HAJ76660.1 DNA helicase RecQ [Gammaproteobacteria bacterium]
MTFESSSPSSILHSIFGFTEFRPPQDQIIDTLIEGGDALVLMPTGGGKSLCYQIPAMTRSGCGIVISPLIALMQDQVSALQLVGVKAAFLNSTLSPEAAQQIEQSLIGGELDLLYVAPERLTQARTLQLLREVNIALFAIDEAHCVSQWGHDFRSDYLQLSLLHELFPDVPRIALTATADERTRKEIIARLQLEEAAHFIAGFDRPNIRYRITLKNNVKQQLLKFLRQEHPDDAGIVYCLSRKKTEDIASWLQEQGFEALPYHAGLSANVRTDHQSRFLREEGVIIVATIAFGMGIDKPDVRFVAHLDLPKTIESYYQETGRAGRDDLAADAWMIYGLQDVIKLRQMMEGSEGSEEFKRAEQFRLNAMLGLCEIISCRRQALLAYFGETLSHPCGNCDTCLEPAQTWDGTEAARKALSAAFRTDQRFGVNHLIDVLREGNTDKIFQFGHQHLPVYGIGKDLDNNQWRSVFRQLVARGYMSVDLDRYGALRLEEKCRPLLRGEESIELRQDIKSRAVKQQTKIQLAPEVDVALWEALRDCRRHFAEEFGVPPYVIFHDSTLQEMCLRLPRDMLDFAELSGVGERKLEKYGPAFMHIIEDHLSESTVDTNTTKD